MSPTGSWAGADNRQAAWESRQAAEAIERAVENLSRKQKEVFSLKYGQGMKLRQVAEVMAISLGTVKTLHHRALNRIRREVAPGAGGEYETRVVRSGRCWNGWRRMNSRTTGGGRWKSTCGHARPAGANWPPGDPCWPRPPCPPPRCDARTAGHRLGRGRPQGSGRRRARGAVSPAQRRRRSRSPSLAAAGAADRGRRRGDVLPDPHPARPAGRRSREAACRPPAVMTRLQSGLAREEVISYLQQSQLMLTDLLKDCAGDEVGALGDPLVFAPGQGIAAEEKIFSAEPARDRLGSRCGTSANGSTG